MRNTLGCLEKDPIDRRDIAEITHYFDPLRHQIELLALRHAISTIWMRQASNLGRALTNLW